MLHRARSYISALVLGVATIGSCTNPTGPDPNSAFGGWSYHRETSFTYSGQQVSCRQTGALNFTLSHDGSVGGTWVASVDRCTPDSLISPGPDRGSISSAHLSPSRAIFSLGNCSYDTGLQPSSQGGRPLSGTGLSECVFTGVDGESVSQTGTLTMARSVSN
jgi:hypothetical protein